MTTADLHAALAALRLHVHPRLSFADASVYQRSWPSLGGDELGRRTLVIPWPFTRRRDDDGTPVCSALVVAIRRR